MPGFHKAYFDHDNDQFRAKTKRLVGGMIAQPHNRFVFLCRGHGVCCKWKAGLRAFIGVETAALTFRTKQYSNSSSSHICYRKRFYNDFFINHNTIALVQNRLKLLSCVVIETALGGMEKNQLS